MPPWRSILAWAGTAFAGGMLLLAGALKALDPAGFAAQIAADVPFLAALAWPLALAGIGVEIALGAALLLGVRHPVVLGLGLAMVVLFLAVTVPKIGDDEAASCGCFGNFVVRTPGQVVVEDLIMLGGLLLGFLAVPGASLRAWRGITAGGLAAGGLTLALAAPSLPLDNFATRLKPGATLEDLQLLEALPELETGEHLVIVAEMALESCEDVPPSLYAAAEAYPSASLWILRPSDALNRSGAMWLCLPGTEVVDIPRPVVQPLYRTLPRSFLALDGAVTTTWGGLPESP